MTRILIVDDESLIVYSLSAALRHEGLQVATAANGQDALNEIRSSFCDICILDIHLPDANGYDLMKIIGEISPATRIILMSAIDLDEAQKNYLRDISGYYLSKPFDLEEVRSIVKRIRQDALAAARNA